MNKSKLVIFLGFSFLFLFVVDSFPIKKVLKGKCERVLDGDTIIVKGQRIRFLGIDAPENDQSSLDHYPIGKWSRDYLVKLIEGKEVEVKWSKRGHYGRIIGEVFYGENINLKMLRDGMAIKSDFERSPLYVNTEYVAKLKRMGIFKTVGFVSPWYYRKQKKGHP